MEEITFKIISEQKISQQLIIVFGRINRNLSHSIEYPRKNFWIVSNSSQSPKLLLYLLIQQSPLSFCEIRQKKWLENEQPTKNHNRNQITLLFANDFTMNWTNRVKNNIFIIIFSVSLAKFYVSELISHWLNHIERE